MAADITVRPLQTLEEFRRCVEITREVWGDSELETEPYITFVIAHHTGGQVLGAFDGDLMVGFTKAFIALRDRSIYLHSHMAAVEPAPAPSPEPSVAERIEVQSRLRSSLGDWFAKGYAIVGVRFTDMGVEYCLAPYSDF